MRVFPALLGLVLLLGGGVSARAQSLTVTPSTQTYAATGGTVTFSVVIRYTEPMASVGLALRAPAGWSFQSSSGAGRPQIGPVAGTTAMLEFAYTSVPASPIEFTFNVAYPAGLTGDQTFAEISAILRPSSGARVDVPHAPVTITATGGGGGGGVTPPTAPTITVQPAGVTVDAGETVEFNVLAAGTAPFSYQWRKDGVNIAGATSAALRLSAVTSAAAGNYSVVVMNAGGSVASSLARLTIRVPVAAPQIVTHPAPLSVPAGSSASLAVAATGTSLTYSWRKDGVVINGATVATLRLDNVQPANAGTYTVMVSNSGGSVLSNPAVLTVQASVAGARFGAIGSGAGLFALHLRPDRTGVFVGYVAGSRLLLVASDVVVDAAGRFRASAVPSAAAGAPASPGTASSSHEYAVEGVLTADGSLVGAVTGLNLPLAAAAPAAGATAGLAGYYRAAAAGSSATSHVIVGAAGEVFVATLQGTQADAGRGLVTAQGTLDLTTEAGARVVGAVAGQGGTLAMNVTRPGGAAVAFVGGNDEVRTEREHLVNISTRSQTSTARALIAGFVITGSQPKPVLVRAIGPSLAPFGVGAPLAAPRLEIFREGTLLVTGRAWGSAANAAAVAETAARVGAFALAGESRDAAILTTLLPGPYTAVVSGEDGSAGVSLVEVYDATPGPLSRDQRIINISTRAFSGPGEDVLIAGFVINGSMPKRVLVRGAGPALAGFGVGDALPRPELTVFSGGTALAQNAGWGTSPDVAAIADASARVGAFGFTAGSNDSAVIINLAPGAYTARVSGVSGATGVALLEVYEVP